MDTTAVVLVDLPGVGEAGLDVQRHLLRDFTHEVHFLLHVNVARQLGFFRQENYADLCLTQLACGDVPLSDLVMVVANADVSLSPEAARQCVGYPHAVVALHEVRTV
ncbi:hypothetical protein ACFU3O_05160 [Streptomyces antibioticus]|uniref:hypothetical protein n=1 Tax=Streptomyces antibioticus TaxID=1890 RepID=UPI00367B0A6D